MKLAYILPAQMSPRYYAWIHDISIKLLLLIHLLPLSTETKTTPAGFDGSCACMLVIQIQHFNIVNMRQFFNVYSILANYELQRKSKVQGKSVSFSTINSSSPYLR